MNSRRSGVGLAVVNGQLLAVGGFDGNTYLKTIEVFDPVSNQWKLYGGMNYRRLGGGVGVVQLPLSDAFGCWHVKLNNRDEHWGVGVGVCLWGWWSFEIAAGCNAFPWQPWEWHPPSHCHTANQWNLTYLPYTYLWVGLDLCREQKNTLQAWASTDNNIQTYHHDNNNNSNNKRKQHTNIMARPQEPLWCN